MNETLVAAEASSLAASLERKLADFSCRQLDQWIAAARDFHASHRHHCVSREATPEVLAQFDRALRLFLHSGRLLQVQLLDFPVPDRASSLDALVWNLNEDWALTHNPMSHGEADELLAKHFPPDEPRA